MKILYFFVSQLFVTVWILVSGHVIDSLVRMLLFHKVVDEVPQQDGLTRGVSVMDRDLMRNIFKSLTEIAEKAGFG